jgi:integrase
MQKTDMPKRKRGRQPKYVLDSAGKPIIGLSLDTANGEFFNTHYRSENIKRINFGTDYQMAVSKYRIWESKRGKSLVTIQNSEIESGGFDAITPDQRTPLAEFKSFDDIPIGADFESNTSKIPESYIIEQMKQIIARDPKAAQEKLGIRFAVVDENGVSKCLIRLTDLLERFQNQPQYIAKNAPISRRQTITEMKQIWKYFCDAIGKTTVGEIVKSDINKYANHVLTEFHADSYSTTWVHKRFSYVKQIFNFGAKEFDSHELDQVKNWCQSLLTSPEMVIQNHAKLIKPEEFRLLLSVSNDFEKAVLLMSMNCGYYATDLANVRLDCIDWQNKTVVFGRNKTGHVHRAAVLWDETIEALQTVCGHGNKSVFQNPETGAPYNKFYFSKLFAKVLKTAVDKIKNDNLKTTIDAKLVHSNCRDSVQTICSIKGNGISQSCDAVLGHRQAGVTGMYTDPATYPQIAADACQAVHDYYFGAGK